MLDESTLIVPAADVAEADVQSVHAIGAAEHIPAAPMNAAAATVRLIHALLVIRPPPPR
jgi:hypothetical protein